MNADMLKSISVNPNGPYRQIDHLIRKITIHIKRGRTRKENLHYCGTFPRTHLFNWCGKENSGSIRSMGVCQSSSAEEKGKEYDKNALAEGPGTGSRTIMVEK